MKAKGTMGMGVSRSAELTPKPATRISIGSGLVIQPAWIGEDIRWLDGSGPPPDARRDPL